MPYQIKRFACSNCHRIFDTFEQADEHEKLCNRCLSCGNAYYVYGCEFNCEFTQECRYPSYKHWTEKRAAK